LSDATLFVKEEDGTVCGLGTGAGQEESLSRDHQRCVGEWTAAVDVVGPLETRFG
jgi:hypothetical protein